MATIGFRPARRERLADILYEQILEQITSGIFGEGDRLPSENEICKAFEVSRPVVREALMRLQADGVLTSRQGVGTFVKHRPQPQLEQKIGPDLIDNPLEKLELLAAIQVEAARMAARRRTEDHLRTLAEIIDALDMSANELAVRRCELGFYRGVVDAAGNRQFTNLLVSLLDEHDGSGSRQLAVRLNNVEKARTLEEYRLVFDAIKSSDAEQAALMMNFHLVRARRRMAHAI